MTPLLTLRPGPNRTLDRLYRRHSGDVYRTALALLRNPEEAEDATQTAFLNAYRALLRGERPREPRSWLLAIVHNVVRMRHRTLSRRPREVPLEEGHEQASLDVPVDLEPVLDALARLPLNQRASIVMREVEGRTYAEIAAVLGVTVSSVEALIFRARRNLRIEREAFGLLGLAPVPASLLGAGAGVGSAAAVWGSDAAIKIAAVIVAGVVVGGAALRGDGNSEARKDWRSGPGVYREATPITPASVAVPVQAHAPHAARRAAKTLRKQRPAADLRRGPLVLFTAFAPAAGEAAPAPRRVTLPVTHRPIPSPAPHPTPGPSPSPPASPPPTKPGAAPPAAPPGTPGPPPAVAPVPVHVPVAPPAPVIPPTTVPVAIPAPTLPPITPPTVTVPPPPAFP